MRATLVQRDTAGVRLSMGICDANALSTRSGEGAGNLRHERLPGLLMGRSAVVVSAVGKMRDCVQQWDGTVASR